MGGKHQGRRQHILLFLATCLVFLIVVAGCRPVTLPPWGETESRLDRLEAELLNRAESFLEERDYERALDYVDQAISCCDGRYTDRALHLLKSALTDQGIPLPTDRGAAIPCFLRPEDSLSSAAAGTLARCWAAALMEVLAQESEIRTLRETTRSQMRRIHSLKEQARILEEQIQALKGQIKRMKAVDLEPEPPKSGIDVP